MTEHHHDVSVVDETGRQRVRLRIEDTAAGFGQLMGLLAEQNAVSEAPITVAIETQGKLRSCALGNRRSGIRRREIKANTDGAFLSAPL